MSYSYKWIGNDIVFSFIGEITFDDLDQANSEIYRDSRFDLMKYAIFDFLRVTHFSLNEEEMILRYLKLMGNNEWDIEYFDHLESAIDWCLK